MDVYLLVLGLIALVGFNQVTSNEEAARQWAAEYNAEAQRVWYENVLASWTYNTNLTDHNQQESVSHIQGFVQCDPVWEECQYSGLCFCHSS